MEAKKKPLFQCVDCIRVYVPDLEKGLDFYCRQLGLKMIWNTENEIGLGMSDDKTEVVIQNKDQRYEVDIKVESVVEAVKQIESAGGETVYGPFDIKVGKCAVVKDLWENQYVLLDFTKGTFVTDSEGNIIGQSMSSTDTL
jgi:lactoylglutathione lyase